MWDIHRAIPIDAWPRARTVVAFRMTGVAPKASRWWLMVSEGAADVCDFDPGYEVAATVETSLRTLIELWRGDVSWSRATLNGTVTIEGARTLGRAVPGWIGQSRTAAVARPA
jgi:putative sterol carrier protein